MNRIKNLFKVKKKNILSVFITAGFPELNDTVFIIDTLEKSGVDMIEIGIPFSDPVADGPAIQESSAVALQNGMSIKLLLRQLKDIRLSIKLPIVLMGYINPVIQYGLDQFCKDAAACGVDGMIIPDLPLEIYLKEWKLITDQYGLKVIFLLTQETSEARIKKIDEASDAFMYMVTSAGTTGGGIGGNVEQIKYFERINKMSFKNPVLAGFGISNKADLQLISGYASGAIVGSHFIRAIAMEGDLKKNINTCIQKLLF